MMPDMDGGDVARVLKNDAETRDIPIIFLSSLVTKREEHSSSKKHGLFFLAKPINRDVLLKWVREYIRKADYYLVED
jgi:putative two-component system response regulator